MNESPVIECIQIGNSRNKEKEKQTNGEKNRTETKNRLTNYQLLRFFSVPETGRKRKS